MRKLIFILLLLPLVANGTILGTRQLLKESAQQQISFNPNGSDTTYIDDSVWNVFINRASVKVAYDGNVIHRESLLVISAGARAYAFDTAVISVDYVLKVRNDAIKPLIKWDVPFLEALGDTILAGLGASPHGYWQFTDSIRLYPTPVTTDTLIVGFSIYPILLSQSNTSTNIPLEFREAIVWYTCHLALWRMGNFGESEKALARYNEEIQKYKVKDADRFDLMK